MAASVVAPNARSLEGGRVHLRSRTSPGEKMRTELPALAVKVQAVGMKTGQEFEG